MAASGQLTGAVILVAGGSGVRLGATVPKAFVSVAGATLLEHAVMPFRAASGPASRLAPRTDPNPVNWLPESAATHGRVHLRAAIVVAPAGYVDEAARLTGLPVVVGGATRQESVAAGLAGLDPDIDVVLVHDVARPFVPVAVIDAVLAALASGAAAVVPIVEVHDTIRRIDASATLGEPVDRSTLAAIQTPQGFRRDLLVQAHAQAVDTTATDDACLIEALGVRVVAVPGAAESFKITTAADLIRAEAAARISGIR